MAPLLLLILFILAWVVLILPRQRELRRHQRLMKDLAVGDAVMMSAGIYGTVVELDEEYARLEVAEGLTLRIARRSIAAKVLDDTPDDADGVAAGETDEVGEPPPTGDGDDEPGQDPDRPEGNEA